MGAVRINASIITIGDELLIGQVMDTNSPWMAAELNKAGIWLKRRLAVGDNREDIIRALDEEAQQSDIILITGGLGPTADDITNSVLCSYFGGKLVVDPEALENVKSIFRKLGRPMIAVNEQQAEVPDVCTVIPNLRGTAPGMWFEKDKNVFVSMPGVPHEMKGMMTGFVIPRLPLYFTLPHIVSRTLLTAGLGESFLAEKIQDFELTLPAYIKLAYLPDYGMVRLRLTAIGSTVAIEEETSRLFEHLKDLVKDNLVTDRDESLPMTLGRILSGRQQTVATAESCTGGYIAHLLTREPGASAFYNGSVVSYDNSIKTSVLQVPAEMLENEGAVSEGTVRAMVAGALNLLKTDFAVAVSGIMGPDGGTPEKPVGTVWIAAGNSHDIFSEKLNLRYDRSRNIEMTAGYTLNLLRKFCLSHPKD